MWKPSITGDLALWGEQVIRDVAKRVSAPQIVERAAEVMLTQTAFPRSTHWLPYSVAQGYAGIAIFWGYMDACFPDERSDVTGREALELAAHDAEGRLSVTIGSFSGLSGLGLAAWNLSRGGVRYRRLLTTVDDVIVPQALQLAADARSLWLAGEALNDDHFRELAIDAMEAVFRRPAASRRIDSPTFCHGKAGLLQIALRFANDTGREKFVTESQSLVREILLAYQPGSLLGFRNIETTDREIDQAGLLDGAPGVALVLLAAISSVAPDWDRLFLLS
jgi:hypothetical protein